MSQDEVYYKEMSKLERIARLAYSRGISRLDAAEGAGAGTMRSLVGLRDRTDES